MDGGVTGPRVVCWWWSSGANLALHHFSQRTVSVFPGAAVTNTTDCVVKQQAFIVSWVPEAGAPSSRCWQGWFLLRPPSLVCRPLSSLPAVSSLKEN